LSGRRRERNQATGQYMCKIDPEKENMKAKQVGEKGTPDTTGLPLPL
jgi:hypothetical protein